MSGLYLYCVTPAIATPGPVLARVRGGHLATRSLRSFMLWSEGADAAPGASPEAIRRHHEVVTAVWSRTPACLPFRFGHWFAGPEEMESAIAGREKDLEEALARVEEAGEFAVRAQVRVAARPSPEAAPPETSGRAYLEWLQGRARKQEEWKERAEAVARELATRLGGRVREERVTPLPARKGLVGLAHLVAHERREEYMKELEEFRRDRPDLIVAVGGPWPPYSFVP